MSYVGINLQTEILKDAEPIIGNIVAYLKLDFGFLSSNRKSSFIAEIPIRMVDDISDINVLKKLNGFNLMTITMADDEKQP